MNGDTAVPESGVRMVNIPRTEINQRVSASFNDSRVGIQVDPYTTAMQERHIRPVHEELQSKRITVARTWTLTHATNDRSQTVISFDVVADNS
ncbi:MAG: hypothetical protein DMG98_14900 [Acidobacteria bacterium]|nr:MAG: hypothetical protein DMG98_14900 [Acidobacteriota bacterium]